LNHEGRTKFLWNIEEDAEEGVKVNRTYFFRRITKGTKGEGKICAASKEDPGVYRSGRSGARRADQTVQQRGRKSKRRSG
jgi:hypothetical protein